MTPAYLCQDIVCIVMDNMSCRDIKNLRQISRDYHYASELLANSKVERLHFELFYSFTELEQLTITMEEIEDEFVEWYHEDEEDYEDEITQNYDATASEWIYFVLSMRDNLLNHYRKFAFNSSVRSLLLTASAVLQTAANTFDPWQVATIGCRLTSDDEFDKYSTLQRTPLICDEISSRYELQNVLDESPLSEESKSIIFEYISAFHLMLICSILRCQEQSLPVVFPCNPLENGDALESALIEKKKVFDEVERQRNKEAYRQRRLIAENANRQRRLIAENAIMEGTPLPNYVYKYMKSNWKGCLPSCRNTPSSKNRFRACKRCANTLLIALSNHISQQ
jgi:hypothetical protein